LQLVHSPSPLITTIFKHTLISFYLTIILFVSFIKSPFIYSPML